MSLRQRARDVVGARRRPALPDRLPTAGSPTERSVGDDGGLLASRTNFAGEDTPICKESIPLLLDTTTDDDRPLSSIVSRILIRIVNLHRHATPPLFGPMILSLPLVYTTIA